MAHNKPIDEVSGTSTTGHEWDGIRELDTPLPRWWLWTFYACIAWSVLYWIAMPALPLASDYTRGLLGYSQRQVVQNQLAKAREGQSVYSDKILSTPLDQIEMDPELLEFALASAKSTFGDNCATCHGSGADGGQGYPNLNDDEWLWGGTVSDIHTTLLYGIRSENDETRFSQMPAFLRDELLTRDQVEDLANYVLSLSGRDHDGQAASRTASLYQEQCSACHGSDGTGSRLDGAPSLTDGIWLYGDSYSAIVKSISNMRGGMMPAWGDRLDPATLRSMAVYIHSLGGGE